MKLSSSLDTAPTVPPALPELALGDLRLPLRGAGIHVATWPDTDSKTREIHALCQRPFPVARFAGGALIGDLSLMDNLFLELSLYGLGQPAHLLPEMDELFALAGSPVRWADWRATPASGASKEAWLQVLVGRALAVDPDLLLLDFGMCSLARVDPGAFSRSFSSRYPWRTLVWACVDAEQSDGLRRWLPELSA